VPSSEETLEEEGEEAEEVKESGTLRVSSLEEADEAEEEEEDEEEADEEVDEEGEEEEEEEDLSEASGTSTLSPVSEERLLVAIGSAAGTSCLPRRGRFFTMMVHCHCSIFWLQSWLFHTIQSPLQGVNA